MNHLPIQVRQGDIFLLPMPRLPEQSKLEGSSDEQGLALVRSEVTGHAHVIHHFTQADKGSEASICKSVVEPYALLWVDSNDERYLEALEVVTLRHEEHSPMTIPPGIYYLPVQVEASTEEDFMMDVND